VFFFIVFASIIALVSIKRHRLELSRTGEVPAEPPRFTLALKSTTGFDNLNLRLTNEFLFSKEGQEISTLDMVGYLMVPMMPWQSNVTLYFTLEPNREAIVGALAEIVVSIPKYLNCNPSQGWSETNFPSANSQMTKSLGAKLDLHNLLPNDWVILPGLTFSNPPTLSPIHVRIRARDMPTIFCSFWMAFPILPNAEKPQINRGQKIIDPDKAVPIPFIRK